jgi:putative oxygen-independent coproporphyrinogen III oxidase
MHIQKLPSDGGKSISAPTLSLYIHFPWCERKCPYCDFNSHEPARGFDEAAYVAALLMDLDTEQQRMLENGEARSLHSIFMGGGTPSLFSGVAIAAILQGIRQRFDLSPAIEITMEANPGTTDSQKFHSYFQAGVNRLSLGFQSLQPAQLLHLERIHSASQALQAYQEARTAGFTNINIDLMHGLPGQDLDTALADLDAVIALKPEHLSWYQLTIEPNTAFYRYPPTLPADDALWDIQQAGHERLLQAGYQPYEVSAYSLVGRQSLHNLNYWMFGDYLAIGAGAHGKLTDSRTGLIRRYWKTRLPDHYLRRIGNYLADQETLSEEDLPLEFMMNALRLVDGVPTPLYTQRTGLPISGLAAILAELRQAGLLDENPDRLACTPLGLSFLNNVLDRFIAVSPEQDKGKI